MNIAYLMAPVVGLLSALHCVGMCGRILSYALAGALLGWLGAFLFASVNTAVAVWLPRAAAAVFAVAVGFYIAGWFPRFARVEQIGEPPWRTLEPVGRRLLPVRTRVRALLYGMVWGWLPRGLVYAMLLAAPAQSSAVGGAVYMALFGLGTLPVMLGAGLLAGRMRGFAGKRAPRLVGGLAAVGLGLFTLWSQSI